MMYGKGSKSLDVLMSQIRKYGKEKVRRMLHSAGYTKEDIEAIVNGIREDIFEKDNKNEYA